MLFDLFCRDGKDIKNFDHDFHDYVCHSRGLRDFDIDLQSSKNIFYALEEAKQESEEISTSTNSFGCLGVQDVKMARGRESVERLTESRMPIPVKMTPTGGYASKTGIRLQIQSPQTF